MGAHAFALASVATTPPVAKLTSSENVRQFCNTNVGNFPLDPNYLDTTYHGDRNGDGLSGPT